MPNYQDPWWRIEKGNDQMLPRYGSGPLDQLAKWQKDMRTDLQPVGNTIKESAGVGVLETVQLFSDSSVRTVKTGSQEYTFTMDSSFDDRLLLYRFNTPVEDNRFFPIDSPFVNQGYTYSLDFSRYTATNQFKGQFKISHNMVDEYFDINTIEYDDVLLLTNRSVGDVFVQRGNFTTGGSFVFTPPPTIDASSTISGGTSTVAQTASVQFTQDKGYGGYLLFSGFPSISGGSVEIKIKPNSGLLYDGIPGEKYHQKLRPDL